MLFVCEVLVDKVAISCAMQVILDAIDVMGEG